MFNRSLIIREMQIKPLMSFNSYLLAWCCSLNVWLFQNKCWSLIANVIMLGGMNVKRFLDQEGTSECIYATILEVGSAPLVCSLSLPVPSVAFLPRDAIWHVLSPPGHDAARRHLSSAITFKLDSPIPRTGRKTFLLIINCPICGTVIAVQN